MSNDPSQSHYDIVIAGGGPAGCTVATLALKYSPDLRVLVLEKARHPREHVGESLLPGVTGILHEMGVWDKMEAQNFPIKIGASLTWGKAGDRWEFDFYPAEEFVDEPRPAKYEGQRTRTAFQVERSVYDEILFRHAQEMGAECRDEVGVDEVLKEGDRIDGLKLSTGEVVTGTHYVDATGHVGLIRRAMGVESEAPKELRNIAFWDYWDNAKWAVEIGVGGTRVQVRSLPYGWMWFIPLGPSRASVGLICPSEYYKESGLTPKELYLKAVKEQPEIRELLKDANSDTGGNVLTTKNWSHLADRLAGENWWICGEAAGFADPILAAGMTLAHGTSREVAYSILECDRGELDPQWIKTMYDEKGRRNIRQHIRFAEYWYAANGRFTDLQQYCKEIAKESGLNLNPSQAWRWLAQGGFTNQSVDQAGFGAFDVGSSKQLVSRFSGRENKFQITKLNEFKLNLKNAEEVELAELREGRIYKVKCYRRGESLLPVTGAWKTMIDILKSESDFETIYKKLADAIARKSAGGAAGLNISIYLQSLEVMVNDGWVIGKLNKNRPTGSLNSSRLIRSESEARKALKDSKATIKFAFETTPE